MSSSLHLPNDPWLREYELAVEMVQEISASIQERNLKYPSGGTQASRATAQARRKIGSLGTAIQTLHSTLADPKSSEGITENERNRRRDLIRTLETKRENLVQQVARDGGNKAGLLASGESSSGPPRETNTTAKLDNQELLQMQDRIMKDQDQELEHIEKSVKTTKHVAGAINEELTLQESLIKGLEDETDTVHNRLAVANRQIKLVMKTADEWKWWCLIFVLVVLLVVAIGYAFDLVL